MTPYQTLISVTALAANIDEPAWRVLDCRFDLLDVEAGRNDYEQSHIPGALYADLERDLSGPVTAQSGRHPLPDASVLAQTFSRWGIDADIQVVVYDAGSGALAARCWWLLRWLGHTQVALLDGGLAEWQRQGQAVASGIEQSKARAFVGQADPGRIISTAELAAHAFPIGDVALVDVRDPVRFRGEKEPLDAVAGHIPGAINLPLQQHLTGNGTWKSAQELALLWNKALDQQGDADVCVMCGSGVTACHAVLASQVAGRPEPRLYAGSWSEWIRDPARPIAIGDPRDRISE